jgi:hypothetical protein
VRASDHRLVEMVVHAFPGLESKLVAVAT